MLAQSRSVLVAILLLVTSTARATAITEPIVFDFEDGLQGWTPSGSAMRVNTQILGGEWAIFGDGLMGAPSGGGARIWIDIDLTDIASISVKQFFAGDASAGADFLVISLQAVVPPPGGVAGPVFGALTDSPDPSANPGIRTFTLNRSPLLPFVGLHELTIWWGGPLSGCIPPCPDPGLPPDTFLGFIDNIILHPIPEPGHLGLLGLLGVLGFRRLGGELKSGGPLSGARLGGILSLVVGRLAPTNEEKAGGYPCR